MRQSLKYTVVIVLTSLSTLAWVHLSRENTRREAVEEYSQRSNVITIPEGRVYVEVKCDAFDVYMIPHDQPSLSDADEAGEEYAKDVRCRDVVD